MNCRPLLFDNMLSDRYHRAKDPARGFFLGITKIFMGVGDYIREVRGEMKHVSWPTRRQAIIYTIVVVLVSLTTAVYLGLWDYVLTALVGRII